MNMARIALLCGAHEVSFTVATRSHDASTA
jgi:hypothetical protein